MSQIKGILSPLLEKLRMKHASKFIIEGSVLDIGCGEGKFIDFINHEVKYLGIDRDKNCIEKAKHQRKYKKLEKCEFMHLFIDKSIKVEEQFDNIIMLAFIEHIDSPDIFLKKITKNLSLQGRIIITTPGPLANLIHMIGSKVGIFDKDAGEEHKMIFNKKGLFDLSNRAGLIMRHYSSFEFGLNNLAVMEKKQ